MNSIHYHKVRSGMNAFITKAQTPPVQLSSQPALTSGDCQWWVAGLGRLLVKIISPIIKSVWPPASSQHLCVLMVSHQADSGRGWG